MSRNSPLGGEGDAEGGGSHSAMGGSGIEFRGGSDSAALRDDEEKLNGAT